MKLIRARFHAAVTMGVHNVPHDYVAVPYASDVNGVRIDGKPIEIDFDYVGDVPGIVVRWGTDQAEFVPMTNVAGLMITGYETPLERAIQFKYASDADTLVPGEETSAPKQRGRPKGSKNKPKSE
jgi:hypothetical protein